MLQNMTHKCSSGSNSIDNVDSFFIGIPVRPSLNYLVMLMFFQFTYLLNHVCLFSFLLANARSVIILVGPYIFSNLATYIALFIVKGQILD